MTTFTLCLPLGGSDSSEKDSMRRETERLLKRDRIYKYIFIGEYQILLSDTSAKIV